MSARWLIAEPPGRALDPLGRLRPARRPDRRGDGRRRPGDPLRRHGRPFRAADHDRAAGPGLDRRPGPLRRRRDRRPPDDRRARAPHRGLRRGRRRLDHLPRGGDPARQPHPRRDPRARLPGGNRDQPGDPGRDPDRAARARRHRPLHDRQPRLGRPVASSRARPTRSPASPRSSARPRSRSTAASTPTPPARSPTPAPRCSSRARLSSAPTTRPRPTRTIAAAAGRRLSSSRLTTPGAPMDLLPPGPFCRVVPAAPRRAARTSAPAPAGRRRRPRPR